MRKRRSVAVPHALLVAFVLMLAACGGGDRSQPEDAAGADAGAGDLAARMEAARSDTALMKKAGDLWARECGACHGPGGGGGVGPNLTDRYWLHGGSPEEIYRSIAKGFRLKGMVAYEKTLSPRELAAMTARVLDLQGTNPPGALPPQGEPEP